MSEPKPLEIAQILSPQQLEFKLKKILEEYLNDCCMVAECDKHIRNCIPASWLTHLLSLGYDKILEESRRARIRTATLFAQFIGMKTLPLQSYCTALEEILEKVDNLTYKCPKIWEYLAEIVAPLLYENILSLEKLLSSCNILISQGHGDKFLGPLFKSVVVEKGPNYLLSLWYNSELIFEDFLPTADVDRFIKDNELEFLVSGASVSANQNTLNFEEIHEKLLQFFENDDPFDDILHWILMNVGDRVKDKQFIRVLSTAVFEHSIVQLKLDSEILRKHYGLLFKFANNVEYELELLYALQEYINKLENPQGLILNVFMVLYEDSKLSKESIVHWSSMSTVEEDEEDNDEYITDNASDKKVYDKEFLLSLRDEPQSRKKPDNLLEAVIKGDSPGQSSAASNYSGRSTSMCIPLIDVFLQTDADQQNYMRDPKFQRPSRPKETNKISSEDVERIVSKMHAQMAPQQQYESKWTDMFKDHCAKCYEYDICWFIRHICDSIPLPVLLQLISEEYKKVLEMKVSKTERISIAHLFVWLIRLKKLPFESYCERLEEILQQSGKLRVENPNIWDYLAEIIVPLIYEDILSLQRLHKSCKILISQGYGDTFLGSLFKFIISDRSPDYLMLIWTKSKLKFEDFIPTIKLDTFIKDFKLDFLLEGMRTSDQKSHPSFEEITEKLFDIFTAKDYDDATFWISMNIGDHETDKQTVIKVLVMIVVEYFILNGFKCSHKLCTFKLLLRYIDGKIENEFELLCALREYINNLDNPKGLFLDVFMMLFKESILSQEGIAYWKSNQHSVEQDAKHKWMTSKQLGLKIKIILEEYFKCSSGSRPICEQIREYIRPASASALSQLVFQGCKKAIERKTSRDAGNLIANLMEEKLLQLESCCAGLEEVLGEANDLTIDIPNVYEYLAEIVVPLLYKNYLPLKSLHASCKILISQGHGAKLLGSVFKLLRQYRSPTNQKFLWNSSELRLEEFMPASNVDKFIKDNQLEFLFDKTSTSANDYAQSFEQIENSLPKEGTALESLPSNLQTTQAEQMTPQQLELKLKNILEEYLNECCTVAECDEDIRECIPVSALSQLVSQGYNKGLERSKTARIRIATLFAHLIRMKTLPFDSYCAGLEEVLEQADDLIIDIPKTWEYLAEIVVPLLHENYLTLKRLHASCNILISKGYAAKLLGPVFKLVVSEKGPNYLTSLWNSSELRLEEFMPASDVDKFIKDNKLEFLFDKVNTSANQSALSFEQIHEKLRQFFENENSFDNISNWIRVNVGDRVQDKQFIRVLATAVFENSIVRLKLNSEILRKHYKFVLKYIDDNLEFELQLLYALQAHINKLEHPQGLLLNVFTILYDDFMLSHDSFVHWESSKDPAEQEGKGVALKQLTSFFTNLKEADKESSASSEDLSVSLL